MVIVGSPMFRSAEIKNTLSSLQHKDDIIFTGRLSQEELSNVLGSALALSFVPLFEGFGIPVLEALYCDVPVISSEQTSLPEVAGEAAIYADPFSTDSIVEAMVKMYEDPVLREKLIKNGRIQREKFSWDKTADKLWKSIESIKL